jgi:hypothetical protein
VCNWIYFHSLQIAATERQRREKKGASAGGKLHNLFVHIPPFSRIALEDQLFATARLIRHIATALLLP